MIAHKDVKNKSKINLVEILKITSRNFTNVSLLSALIVYVTHLEIGPLSSGVIAIVVIPLRHNIRALSRICRLKPVLVTKTTT